MVNILPHELTNKCLMYIKSMLTLKVTCKIHFIPKKIVGVDEKYHSIQKSSGIDVKYLVLNTFTHIFSMKLNGPHANKKYIY